MNDIGNGTGFMVIKLGILLAVIALIGSAIDVFDSFERTSQREELDMVIRNISNFLREAEAFTESFRIRRDIPDPGQDYILKIDGEFSGEQIVNLKAVGSVEVSRKVILSRKINGGDFRIEGSSPDFVKIFVDDGVFLEVV